MLHCMLKAEDGFASLQNKKAHAIVADLEYPTEWDRIVEDAVGKMGGLEVLVNNPAPFGASITGDPAQVRHRCAETAGAKHRWRHPPPLVTRQHLQGVRISQSIF